MHGRCRRRTVVGEGHLAPLWPLRSGTCSGTTLFRGVHRLRSGARVYRNSYSLLAPCCCIPPKRRWQETCNGWVFCKTIYSEAHSEAHALLLGWVLILRMIMYGNRLVAHPPVIGRQSTLSRRHAHALAALVPRLAAGVAAARHEAARAAGSLSPRAFAPAAQPAVTA